MLFETIGDRGRPAVLFFHAMGVTGASSEPVAAHLRRQLRDSLEDKPFPPLPEGMQENSFFAFGSAEEHFKYRNAVMEAYPKGRFPVFEGYNHMQYQIRDPRGFAEMLRCIAERGELPALPFIRK